MCKKTRIILCLAVAFLLFLCGCTAKEHSKLPQLMIGCDDYEPYSYTDEDGEPAGMDVELAKEACRRLGMEPIFLHIDWNTRDTGVGKWCS